MALRRLGGLGEGSAGADGSPGLFAAEEEKGIQD